MGGGTVASKFEASRAALRQELRMGAHGARDSPPGGRMARPGSDQRMGHTSHPVVRTYVAPRTGSSTGCETNLPDNLRPIWGRQGVNER
jgi:hypothetical protein